MVEARVRIARVIMVAQAVASLGIWIVQVLTISVRLDHGQEVPGSVWLVIVINPLIAILLALAAVAVTRQAWARSLAVFMEVIGALGALVSVTTGFYQAVIAILLAVGVIVLLVSSSHSPGSQRSTAAVGGGASS